MEQRLIITNVVRNEQSYIVCALYKDKYLIEVSARPRESSVVEGEKLISAKNKDSITANGKTSQVTGSGILGNIYVGRVKDVVQNLNAAFIEIAPGVSCYYPLEELKHPIFVKKINSPRLVQGDELLVQVEKEAMKTKPPKVTTNLNFTGKYLVLTTENKMLGISKKLGKEIGSRFRELLEAHRSKEFGIVVRTNSQNAAEQQILEELAYLENKARQIIAKAPYQTCFTCMLKQEPEFIKTLQNVYTKELGAIVTDDEELYKEMKKFLQEQQPEDLPKLQFYEDRQWPLAKCYSLEVKLEEALRERVWLKTGGYLIIQHTEAMTVIDVNSGKSVVKKGVQEHYLKVNLEAAAEIAVQLRLRNISGIVMVDFIDMKSMEAKQQLLEALKRFTEQDPVPVQVVGMTKLNLVEMTRKKVKKSLREQFA